MMTLFIGSSRGAGRQPRTADTRSSTPALTRMKASMSGKSSSPAVTSYRRMSSLAGFGGGPSMITLIQNEVVDLRRWLTGSELLDAYAFANTLPSPIATKLAAFVGYHQAGWAGVTVALIGVTIPTAVLTILAGAVFTRYREHRLLVRFLAGVRPVVLALLMYVVWDFTPATFGTDVREWLANWWVFLVAAGSVVALLRFKMHPLPLIVAGGTIGLLFSFL